MTERASVQLPQLLAVVVIVAMFAATQISNANTPITNLQRPGNHLDDARLTNAVRQADSVSQALKSIDFGQRLIVPSYFLDKYFGIGSDGRRFLSALMVIASVVYLLTLVARYRLLKPGGIVFLALLVGLSAELTVYASTGLNTYPTIILLGVCLLHVLLNFENRPLGYRELLFLNIVFVAVTLVFYRTIVAVYAVAFVLSFRDVFERSFSWRSFARRCVKFLALVSASSLITVYTIYVDTPFEFANPHRGLQYYFFEADHAKNPFGFIAFYLNQSINQFWSIVRPHPYIGSIANSAWLQILLLSLLVVGLITSWRKACFGLSMFLLLGVLGHIFLNLATIVPWGNPRYFLPFFMAVPVITAAGAENLVGFASRLMGHRMATAGKVLAFALVFLAILAPAKFLWDTNKRNLRINEIIVGGIAVAVHEHEVRGAGIVVDYWTNEVVRAEHRSLVFDDNYLLNTQLKTKWRNKVPTETDDLSAWEAFLADQESITLVTSMPFTAANHGGLFTAATERFNVESRARFRTYNFSVMRAKERKMPD
jgi:hypothetical protein